MRERAKKNIPSLGTLYERSAEDVLTLSELGQRANQKHADTLIYCATALTQSLSYDISLLPGYAIIRRHKALKRASTIELLRRYSSLQIISFFEELLTLEGVDVKKKVIPAGTVLEEPQPTV